jgi:hypothetical protein
LTFLLLTSFSYHHGKDKNSLNCSEFTEKYVDQVTGVKRYIAKDKIALNDYKAKNSFDLIWFKTKDEYTLAFKATDPICFQNDVAVSFHLLQGKVVTCASSHIENCESLMTVNFEESQEGREKIEMLMDSEVVGISFENKAKEYKLKMRRRQSQEFQQTIQCLETRK